MRWRVVLEKSGIIKETPLSDDHVLRITSVYLEPVDETPPPKVANNLVIESSMIYEEVIEKNPDSPTVEN